jgi:excisionase family DNA binding protein
MEMKQALFSFAAPIVLPQGDGSYIVRSGKPVSEVTASQAAEMLGISRCSIYKILERGDIPIARRPLKKKILLNASDVQAYKDKTSDTEYWEEKGRLMASR